MSSMMQRGDDSQSSRLERCSKIHLVLEQALRWRVALWDALLEDLEQRDPLARNKVREALAAKPALMYRGRSTRHAMWAWQALDATAREEWMWVCRFIQEIWIRGELGVKLNGPDTPGAHAT